MSKFLYLFRGGDAAMAQLSPEDRQAHMQKWGAWMQALAQDGKLVDGLPLDRTGRVVEQAGAVVHDGPFAEGAELVGGYLIVNADNLDAAVELSKDCPIYEAGGSTEIRGLASM